jgi:pyruvate,orthophosphate dikinase
MLQRVSTKGAKSARSANTAKGAKGTKALGNGRAGARASKTSQKYVYLFGAKTDGNGSMKPLLGGKGANLAEMCRIALPVTPGFTSPLRSAPTTTSTNGRIRRH